MKHTSPALLIAAAVVGGVGGFGIQAALAAASFAKLRPEYTFPLSLAIIAALVIVLAVPIRRAVRGPQRRPIDPFYATRVVVLAKASSIVGALLAGGAVGLLADLVLRGSPNGDTFLRIIAALVGSVVLLVAGLVAEYLCRVPPNGDDDDDRRDGHPERVRS
jgi:uncharacterized membrane protein YeaQ/YmgE (transglycosylase-associated protein family)